MAGEFAGALIVMLFVIGNVFHVDDVRWLHRLGQRLDVWREQHTAH